MTNDIQRKHREENDLIIEDALSASLNHLHDAHNRFGATIQDPDLNAEFTQGIDKAEKVLAKLGIE